VWSSPLFDTSGFDAWSAAGSRTLEERLHDAALELAGRGGPVVDEHTAALLDAYWTSHT
jgi:trimethylamine:corrinoid methyltransferase-like protein